MTKRPKTGRSRLGVESLTGWLRNRRIGIKLGFILFVPTLATVIVGANGLVGQISNANTADRARTLANLSADGGTLVNSLQDERADALVLLNAAASGSKSDETAASTAFHNQQVKTSQASSDYVQQADATSDVPADLRSRLTDISGRLNGLAGLRQQITTATSSNQTTTVVSQVTGQYTALITPLLRLRDSAAQLAGDPALSFEMRAAGAIAQAKEFASQEKLVGLGVLLAPGQQFAPTDRTSFIGGEVGQDQAKSAYQGVATPDQINLYNQTLSADNLRPSGDIQDKFTNTIGSKAPTGITADQWATVMSTRAGLYRDIETALDREIIADATSLRDSVERTIILDVALLFAIILLAMLIAWFVARSMNRALRELKHGALTIARQGLPQAVARLRDPSLATQLSPQQIAAQIAEPLPVRSKDEFGEVTEAFNAVHIEAVRTAAEQAVLRSSVATMFVNLARRSQILVDRLIGHLDRLERGEEDPDRLAELFQLDHLATRMRRNDENLLVLAGADSTRVQREPAPLVDVLRAAQSEVEHYTRIEFGNIDRDLEIGSHAVNDLVHLVAELLDNATAFSPPDSPVLIEARRFGDRAVLYVEDRGIGISGDQIADLNDRLAKPPLVDVAVSRMMGLVVVARLAARHGIEVKLRPAADRGTVADVLLPSSVLVNAAAVYRNAPPMAGAERAALNPNEPPRPPVRSPFGPPLALESGPSATERTPAGSGSPSGYAGAAAGGFGPADTGEFGGFAASAERFGTSRPAPLGPGASSRALPSWSDLTGATSANGQRSPYGATGGYTGSGYPGDHGHSSGTNGYNGAAANGSNGLNGTNGAAGSAGSNGHGGAPGYPSIPTAPLPRRAAQPDDTGAFDAPPFGDGPSAFDAPPFGTPDGATNEGRRPFGGPPPNPFDAPDGAQPFRVPRQRPQGFGSSTGDPSVEDPADAEVVDDYRHSAPPIDADDAEVTRAAERPSPTSAPPAWPPVSAQPAMTGSDETANPRGSSGRVEALDMTAEIPRFRDLDLAAAASPADDRQQPAPTARPVETAPAPQRQVMPFADQTMELPIFKAVESAWFAATGSSGQSLIGSRQSDVATAEPPPRQQSREVPQPRAAEVPVEARPSGSRPTPGRPMPTRPEPPVTTGGRPGGYPDRSEYHHETVGGNQMAGSASSTAGVAEQDWHSTADDGWLAAAAASEPADGGLTPGGLPRRVPLAQLVPGSVERTTTGSNRRSPDAVRGLLSAYHRGVQRGRQQMSDDSPALPESTSGRPTPGGKEQDK